MGGGRFEVIGLQDEDLESVSSYEGDKDRHTYLLRRYSVNFWDGISFMIFSNTAVLLLLYREGCISIST